MKKVKLLSLVALTSMITGGVLASCDFSSSSTISSSTSDSSSSSTSSSSSSSSSSNSSTSSSTSSSSSSSSSSTSSSDSSTSSSKPDEEKFPIVTEIKVTNLEDLNRGWKIGEASRTMELEISVENAEPSEIMDDLVVLSDNEEIVSVNNLTITPKKVGSANITIGYQNDVCNYSTKVTIEVKNVPDLTQFSIDAQASFANYYEKHQGESEISAVYTNGSQYRFFTGNKDANGDYAYYDLGSYDEATDTFSNTNRFVVDYDNNGAPVVVDLNSTLSGIENMELKDVEAANALSLDSKTFVGGTFEQFRYTTADKVKAYNVILKLGTENLEAGDYYSPTTFGSASLYDPMFSYTLGSDNTYQLTPKSFYYNVRNGKVTTEKYRYNDDYASLISDTSDIDVEKKDLNYEISFGETVNIPEKFNGVAVTATGYDSSFVNYYQGSFFTGAYYRVAHIIDVKTVNIPNSFKVIQGNFFNDVSDAFNNPLTFNLNNSDLLDMTTAYFPMSKEVSFDNLTTLQFASRATPSYQTLKTSDIIDHIVEKSEAETYTGYKLVLTDNSKLSWKDLSSLGLKGTFNIYNSEDFNSDGNLNLEAKTFTANFDSIPNGMTLEVPYKKDASSYYLLNEASMTDKGNQVFDKFKDEATRTMIFELANDLNIEGTLNVGSLWSHVGQTVQGAISGEYASIDLKGHTLTVKSGGVLNGMTLITDSVGTGKIIVENGGKILTPFVITNYRGGTISTGRANSNQFPFDDYLMPYLDCEVELQYGSSMTAKATANANESPQEIDIDFIGSSNKSLFQMGENAKVVLSKSYQLDSSTNKVDRNTYVENMKFSGDISINALSVSIALVISINTNKMALPFSQYLHIEHTDGTLTVSSLTQVAKGAYFSTSDTSTIVLTDNDSSKAQSGIYAMNEIVDQSINYKDVSYDASYAATDVTNNSSNPLYYYAIKRPDTIQTGVNINGKLVANGTGHVIGGKINLSESVLQTILDNPTQYEVGNFNAFTTSVYYSKTSGTFVAGSGILNKLSIASSASFYQTLPLVTSQGIYIKSGSEIIKVESFDESTGVATTAEGKTYALFLANDAWKFKGSVKDNALGSWQEVTVDSENHVVKYNDKNYIYFLGTMNEATNNGTNWTINNKRFLFNCKKADLVVEGLTMQFVNNTWAQLLK